MQPDIDHGSEASAKEMRVARSVGRTPFKIILFAGLVAAFGFALDLSLPLGIAGGVPYVALILIGTWFTKPRHIYLLAVVGTALTVIGFFLSSSGSELWIVLVNRGLALFAIWITAFLLASRKQFENSLVAARDELETKVIDRTVKLQASEERFRDFAESGSDWFWEQGADFRFTEIVSFRESKFLELAKKSIGLTRWEAVGANPDEDEHWQRHVDDLMAHRNFRDFRYITKDSEQNECTINISGKPVFSKAGNFKGYRGTATDVTGLVQAQHASQRLEYAIDHLSEALALWDADEKFVLCNEFNRKVIGPAAEELKTGIKYEAWLQAIIRHGIAPEAVGREEAWLTERLSDLQNPAFVAEVNRNGRWYRNRFQRLPDGSTIQMAIDIHDVKLSEEALRQAQRMEAIGQLTGGVAHDFNNLMAAMIGNADLLEDRVSEDKQATKYVEGIKRAVRRGASLTSRLLAFSRKQSLSPESTDIAVLIGGLEDMFRRTLEESVDLIIKDTSNLWSAMIDPYQFEDALLNLVINARDAMPDGGQLVIEASNVILDETYTDLQIELMPGDYVKLSVSDTGVGIAPEILEKVFEPFFTTKDVGTGSGLGLSMVFGFVKQSKGHIAVYSELDHGTTISLYFPCADEAAIKAPARPGRSSFERGSERILVVEDDENVREVAVKILQNQGYEVIEAVNGEEALKLLRDGQVFDLLFTDIVLPGGMNGAEMAKQARTIQSNIKSLYTTGYTENAIVHKGQLNPGENLLSKPYRRADLLKKVRTILDDGDD